MATIVTRSGKGSPLTNTEVDSNFTNLNTDKIEDAPSDGNQYARQSGSWAAVAAAATVVTSSTAPSSPSDGDVWYSESNGVTYVYYADGSSSQWVATGAPTGSLGGFNSLSEMSDVAITSVQDKDILVYDSGTSKWVNEAPVAEMWEASLYSFSPSATSDWISNWSRQVSVNGSITSSGSVFSFPSTGNWLVEAHFSFYGFNSSSRTAAVLGGSLRRTTNGSSYTSVGEREHLTTASNTSTHAATGTVSYVFAVSSTSTHKVALYVEHDGNAVSTDKLQAQVYFQRLSAV